MVLLVPWCHARLHEPRTTGYLLLVFPPLLFSVQSYGLYAIDVQGGKFTTTRPKCYVSEHTMVYDEGE
jgi:hypothetical protein